MISGSSMLAITRSVPPQALTGFDVDAKGALQALHPAHDVVLRGARLRAAAAPCRSDRRAQVAVRGEKTMKAREVYARQGHEGGQACHEVERLEEHVRGAVTIGRFQRVTNALPAVCARRSVASAGRLM